MTREEKLKAFKEKGFTYNKETGEIFSHTGKLIKGKNGCGYITCGVEIGINKTTNIAGHILAWYLETGEVPNVIDHINHNRSDNRLVNLRNLTNQQNQFNRESKGYYWNKQFNKWRAQLYINGKNLALGLFDNKEEARQAYLDAKKIHHVI